MAEALEAAISAVSKYGGANAGYRTLLDALIPASAVLKEVVNWLLVFLLGSFYVMLVVRRSTYGLFCLQRLDAGDNPVTAFLLSSEAALAGAESTIHMQAQVILSLILSLFPSHSRS